MIPIGWWELEQQGASISQITLAGWGAMTFLGVACSFLATLLYFIALQHSESQKVGVYLYTIPPMTAVIAAFYLGEAIGLNLIADDFSQQLVVEMAMLGVTGDDAMRNAAGPQYGLGARYQLPISNSLIFRADGMLGFLEDDDDVRGLRFEIRRKY